MYSDLKMHSSFSQTLVNYSLFLIQEKHVYKSKRHPCILFGIFIYTVQLHFMMMFSTFFVTICPYYTCMQCAHIEGAGP